MLANLLERTGHRVGREYYINDAGRQIRTLGRSAYLRLKELKGETVDYPPDLYQGDYVREIARKVIDDAGYGRYFGHSFGHSVGLDIHEHPLAAPAAQAVMPVGCMVSAEPGIYIPGSFGVRIEDVLLLKEDGCEDITRAPKQLTIL